MPTPINYDEVSRLQKKCESRDGIALKLNWDMLNMRQANDEMDLAEYRDGKLVAFLGKYDFGSTLEMCGMVDPEYRRQGIFTSLLHQALNEATLSRYTRILLNAPENSVTALQFLKSVPFGYAFSEYQMKYEKFLDQDQEDPMRADITLRRAVTENILYLASLDHEGFDIPLEEAQVYYESFSPKQIADYELILHDEQPVGKIRVDRQDNEAWIYGFVISMAYRGRGFGGAALRRIVERELAAGYDIWLEVALDNPIAKKLYESAGFKVIRAQDYYQYSAGQHSD